MAVRHFNYNDILRQSAHFPLIFHPRLSMFVEGLAGHHLTPWGSVKDPLFLLFNSPNTEIFTGEA
jgi:hypothetical protein